METFQRIQQEAFGEIQKIIQKLNTVQLCEEWIKNKSSIVRLNELTGFLSELEKYAHFQNEAIPNNENENGIAEIVEIENLATEEITENSFYEENDFEENTNAEEPEEESISDFEDGKESVDIQENESSIKEKLNEEIQPSEENEELKTTDGGSVDKKIKVPSIRGIKKTGSLFDDEVFEAEQIEPVPSRTPKLTKEFKLDLNDRIAFTNYLFDGSQTELNETVRILNSFDKLDDAMHYLSDVYYERNWKKVDDYAQRLWTLVENKFI